MATVLAWNDALSEKNLGTLVDLSSDDIEIGDSGGAAALSELAQGDPGRMDGLGPALRMAAQTRSPNRPARGCA